MIVYHGSYCKIKFPDISFSRNGLDFGRGFYTTRIKQQAIDWTYKFFKKGESCYLNSYDLKINEIKEKYKIKVFLKYDEEWLDFITDCRAGSFDCFKYDIIIGSIADDKVYNTLALYQHKLITKSEALKRLQYYKPNQQICINRQEVIDEYLIYQGSEKIR